MCASLCLGILVTCCQHQQQQDLPSWQSWQERQPELRVTEDERRAAKTHGHPIMLPQEMHCASLGDKRRLHIKRRKSTRVRQIDTHAQTDTRIHGGRRRLQSSWKKRQEMEGRGILPDCDSVEIRQKASHLHATSHCDGGVAPVHLRSSLTASAHHPPHH